MLACADCGHTMQPLDCGGVVVDRCRKCAGIWFDDGELGVFRDGLERRDLTGFVAAPSSTAPTARSGAGPCPRCQNGLNAGEYAYGTGVRVARCSGCEGVWLPGTQVARFIAHMREAREKRAETREIAESVAETARARVERHHPFRNNPYSLSSVGRLFGVFNLLPLHAEDRGNHAPCVTFALVAIFVLLQLFVPEHVANELVLVPARLFERWQFGSLVSASFLHGGWGHLIGNAIFFVVFGRALESTLGSLRFTVIYFASDLAASLAWILSVGLSSNSGCVGASGAISGVMGAYFVLLPKAKVRVFLAGGSVRVPAWAYLGGWFVLQAFSASTSIDSSVAWSAHLGGFLAGALLGWRCREAEDSD